MPLLLPVLASSDSATVTHSPRRTLSEVLVDDEDKGAMGDEPVRLACPAASSSSTLSPPYQTGRAEKPLLASMNTVAAWRPCTSRNG